MDLKNRTILLMGGGAYAKDIAAYQEKTGFRIVTVGRDKDTPISRMADAFYNVDTQNVDAVVDIVEKEKVDGIFVGSSEVNISPAIDVSERSRARFYATRAQWDVLADKAKFKDACRAAGVPVVKEYSLSEYPSDDEILALPFPVLLKPVDSSGARGMHACYSIEEFKAHYAEALTWSKKRKVIIEELITNAREVFFQYNIQDGNMALSSCFTKVFTETENKELILPIFHMYPSKFIEEYYETVHEAVIRLFRDLDIQNGYMTLQSFYKDDHFYVFEAGYRMGGAQNYIFTDYQNGVNALEGMINYALTGHMSDDCMVNRDNARFKYPCCNYYVGLKPGTIERMGGVEEVRKMPGVLNVTVMSHIGQVVEDTNALERVCLRIHVLGETKDALAKLLVRISQTLRIISTEGEEMQLEHLTYDRCITAINNSVKIGGEYNALVIFTYVHEVAAFERRLALCA